MALVATVYASFKRINIWFVPRGYRLAAFLKALFGVLSVVFYFWGISLLTSSKSLLLYNMTPLFVGLLAWCFLRESLHCADFVSLLSCFTGVFLVTYFAVDEAHKYTQTQGVFVMLAAAAFSASAIIV